MGLLYIFYMSQTQKFITILLHYRLFFLSVAKYYFCHSEYYFLSIVLPEYYSTTLVTTARFSPPIVLRQYRKYYVWSHWSSSCQIEGDMPPQSCSRVGLTIGSGQVGLSRVGSGILTKTTGRVGSRPWRVGSGSSTLTRPDPPCFSKTVNVNLDSDTQPTLCKLFPTIQGNLHHP